MCVCGGGKVGEDGLSVGKGIGHWRSNENNGRCAVAMLLSSIISVLFASVV